MNLPRGPLNLDRRDIKVAIPCLDCSHHGVCSIEEQIEDNLVLQVMGISVPVKLELSCSLFVHVDHRRRPRNGWSPERHIKFQATMAAKREAREHRLDA